MGVKHGMSFTPHKRPSEKTHTAVSCEEPRGRGPHSQISFCWTPPVWKSSIFSRGAANYGTIGFSERRRYSTDERSIVLEVAAGICPIGGFCMTGHFPGALALGDKGKYLHVNSAVKYITDTEQGCLLHHMWVMFRNIECKMNTDWYPTEQNEPGMWAEKANIAHLVPVAAPKRSGKWNIMKMTMKLDAESFPKKLH